MDIKRNLSKNLKALIEARNGSLQEFADEINIPRTTLQTILTEGNTTLETLCRISEGTGLSPELLLQDDTTSQKVSIAQWVLQGLACYDSLPKYKQQLLTDYVDGIMEVVGYGEDEQKHTADWAYL